ncbi:MAG: tetratricopeptide repeat protein, partial [Gemmatimonadota bacterium]
YALLESVDPSTVSYAQERLALYTSLIEREPRNPTVRKQLGLFHAQLGELERAEEELSRVVSLNPYSADGYYNLGFLYRVQGRYDRALRSFQTADSLRPGYARDELAFTLIELGRYAEARRHLVTGLGTPGADPEQVIWTHLSLGGLAIEAGDTATARAEIESAARLVGTGTGGEDFVRQTVLGEKAHLAWVRGDAPELDRILLQMEAVPSETPALHLARAQRSMLAADSTAAIRELEQAVEASSANQQPTYLYELADVLRAAGRVDEAEEAYRRILTINPDWPRAHYGLGMAFAARGEPAAARRELGRFLELWSGADSTLKEVRQARETLAGLEAS